MSSFEDLRKMQARQKQEKEQEEARKLEEKKRAEAEHRENQYRYNKAKESAERARQSFLMTQESQNNRIWHHFSSLIPEILDEFGQLIYGNYIEKKVEYTRGFLGLGSSEIVREISHKNYNVREHYRRQDGFGFILEKKSSTESDGEGYLVQQISQKYIFTEQYSKVENGIQKLDICTLTAVAKMEYCKVSYCTWKTSSYRFSPEYDGYDGYEKYLQETGGYETSYFEDSDNLPAGYICKIKRVENDIHAKDMVKLQRSDIEKALTEIWQARGSNKY